jgi:LAO/AO transport system kinase
VASPVADLVDARLAALVRGERLAVASSLNDVEDSRAPARVRSRALLAALAGSGASDRAHRVGLTGPPGVGKSSLVAAFVRALRVATPARSVGVLAVDPSSVRSGGALLGDRVRIATDGEDAGVFIRSLATRGDLGGLARAVAEEVVVLSAAFDVVLVETVGVGQSEADVRDVVDTLVFVVQPGAGDTLQHLKAGVMEAPDLFVVNKADAGALAERTRSELRAALASLKEAGIAAEPPPVVTTSARDGTGIDELVAAIDAHRTSLAETGELTSRRRASAIAHVVRAFGRRYGELGIERAGGARAVLDDATRRLMLAGDDPGSVVLAMNPYGDVSPNRS